MPDRRQHRGPHPEDHSLFAANQLPRLQAATRDLSWLLSRRYAPTSARKLVGDRYGLDARQRLAVVRCACGEQEREQRTHREVQPGELAECELWIDGYNVLTSLEAALSDGVILLGRDGCYRDLASMHGSYRKVEETIPAVHRLGEALSEWRVASCRWLLDQPVSNSGRLKTLLRTVAAERGWAWAVELVPDPDAILVRADRIVASADSQILDGPVAWFNLARRIISQRVTKAWIVDLSGSDLNDSDRLAGRT